MKATLRHLEEWASPRTVIALTLLLLGGLWSAVIVSAVTSRQESIVDTGERLQNMTRAVEEQTRQTLRLADTLLAICKHWIEENPQQDPRSDPAFRKLLEDLRTRSGEAIDIYLLAADGQLFDVSNKAPKLLADLSDHDLFRSASASAGLFIGRPLQEPWTDRAGLPLALALQRPVHGIRIVLAVVDVATLFLAQLQQLATTDWLTGTSSRQHLFATLEEQLVRAHAQQSPLTVVLFDIDFFKRINDGYGHAVGDQVLIAFAEVATRCLGEVAVLGRLGAGEFSMLLPDTDAAKGIEIAEQVRAQVAEIAIPTDNGTVRFTASAGASEALPTDQTADDLLKRAARALQEAKAGGHDRAVLF